MFGRLFSYIKLGYAIFPVYSVFNGKCACGNPDCKSIGKHSKIGTGPVAATRNIQIVNSQYDFWSNANIGIATGRISGIVVLDVDPRDGGDESLKKFEDQYGKLPETVTAISGGGGLHYYFKYPDFKIPTRNHFRAGLDFKSDRDWVIVPPSMHLSGSAYKWQESHSPNEISPVKMPEWLAKAILSM